jgi:carboxyl-terminal processing protease
MKLGEPFLLGPIGRLSNACEVAMTRNNAKVFALLLLTIAASVSWQELGARTRSSTHGLSPDYRQLDLFGNAFGLIISDYVESPDQAKLMRAAINGMLASLDPHSSFMTLKEFKEFQVESSGKFGGLGLEVTMESGILKVIAPLDDTPAAHAGILANDLITHLDGQEVVGMALNEAIDKMRGRPNTRITLTIQRPGKKDPFDVKLTRDLIQVKSVKANAEGDVGYLRISSFTEQTQAGIDEAVTRLEGELGRNLKGWILDLRNNPGGLVDQAVSVSNTFLKKGEIVSIRGRDPAKAQHLYARSGRWMSDKAVVVLINGGSASASEIVAGALQDHKRATVIGTRSFGKGSVQSVMSFGNEGALVLTTARYYTPSGRSIQAKGITPDVVVAEDLPADAKPDELDMKSEAKLRGHLKSDTGEEQTGSSSYVPKDKAKDKQLQAAIDLLHGKQVGLHAKTRGH